MLRAASWGRRSSKACACSAKRAVSRSVRAMISPMRPSIASEDGCVVAEAISAHALHLQHLLLHRGGDADAAALGDLLGEGVHHEGAEGLLALAAAEWALGGDALKHLAQHAGQE